VLIGKKLLGLILASLSISVPTILLADNSLAHHPSPYLAMHADDPIDWRIWEASVLKQAQQQNKLIFVSVGYFSCHWCHVMQRESFSKTDVAKILNRDFIAVKIDRELRPELDRRLILFVDKLRGSSGWPLNVFLTPQGYPLTGFTYLPRPNFIDVLQQLQRQWLSSGKEISTAAQSLFIEMQNEAIANNGLTVTDRSHDKLALSFLTQAMSVADELQGGFGDTSKFPQVPQLLSLINLIDQAPEIAQELTDFAHLTLASMAERNLMDHVNGGFFRYTTDPDWQTPHYEKMLYDNAQMVLLYYRAESLWPDRGYRQVAETTLQFIQSSMHHSAGGYVSSLSAVDINNLEGGRYLWDWRQLQQDLPDQEYDYLRNLWKIKANGSNSEVFLPGPLVGIGSSGDAAINTKIRQRLQSLERPIMPVDDKRLASWNALMLQALVVAAASDQQYRKVAEDQFRFMREAFIENGEMVRFAGNGNLAETTFEDHAQASLAFLEYGRLLQDADAIRWAQKLALSAYQRYFDSDRWHANSGSLIPTDPGQWVIQDSVSPSAQTAWLKVIMSLPDLEDIIGQKAEQILYRVTKDMLDTPYYYGTLIALRQQLNASPESITGLQ
jgi:uncharacterized protein YyaL (SSP411 family)